MTTELGFEPDDLRVRLVAGGDFVTELVNEDEAGTEVDWPVGTTIALQFGHPTEVAWNAVIAGAVATFNVDKAQVDVVLALNTKRVRMHYINGTEDIPWAIGWVKEYA